MKDAARFTRSPRIEADVQLLLGRFRDLLPDGRVLMHVEIESVLKLSRSASRYHSVTNQWRKILFDEQHIFLDGRSAHGQGFVALTPDDMVRYANRRVRAVGRALRKALAVVSLPRPDELTNNDLRTYQARLLVATEQILTAHKHTVIELSQALRPTGSLPRPPRV